MEKPRKTKTQKVLSPGLMADDPQAKDAAVCDEVNLPSELKALKVNIIAELKSDAFMKAVSGGLEEKTTKHYLSKFFQHPAFLVLLTFACTSLLGNFLTSSWQTRQLNLQERYQTIDLTNRALAESMTAAEDILGLYTYDASIKNRDRREETTRDYWQHRSREWRISSNVILQKLKVNFDNPEISKSFANLKEKQYEISVDIRNLQGDVDEKTWNVVQTEDFLNERKRLLKELSDLRGEVGNLLDLMVKETENQ